MLLSGADERHETWPVGDTVQQPYDTLLYYAVMGLLVFSCDLYPKSREIHEKEREWMGVEPTAARSARPATDFEDRGAHRDTTTPRI